MSLLHDGLRGRRKCLSGETSKDSEADTGETAAAFMSSLLLPAASATLADVRRPLRLAAETVRPMPRHMSRVAVIAYFVFVLLWSVHVLLIMEVGWFTAHVFDRCYSPPRSIAVTSRKERVNFKLNNDRVRGMNSK